jgi:diguanylate cyclase (GGDEF)-like protein
MLRDLASRFARRTSQLLGGRYCRALATELRAADRRLAQVLSATGTYPYTAIIYADGRAQGVFSAAAYERLIGAPVPSGLQPDEAWRSRIHPEDRDALTADREALRRGEPQRLAYRILAAGGEVVWVIEHMEPRWVDGVLLVDGILIDVSVQRRLEQRLREALADARRRMYEAQARSLVDPLTLIPNRRHFDDALTEEFPLSRDGARLGVLLIDVDHFKLVNDTYGHPVGDGVLVEIARRLSAAIAPGMLVARWGGEEFCAMAIGVRDEHDLRTIGETIRRAIEAEPIVVGDPPASTLALTVSVGGALADIDATPAELIERADRALYAAKRRGRNQVRLGGDLRSEEASSQQPARASHSRFS